MVAMGFGEFWADKITGAVRSSAAQIKVTRKLNSLMFLLILVSSAPIRAKALEPGFPVGPQFLVTRRFLLRPQSMFRFPCFCQRLALCDLARGHLFFRSKELVLIEP